MSRKRTLAAIAMATSVLLGGGVVAATNAYADPQVIRCAKYPPDYTVVNSWLYTVKVFNAQLVQTYYNSDNVPINCLYQGDAYLKVLNGSWTYYGPYSYKRPYFEYI